MKETVKYIECLKFNCQQHIENLNLYYYELSKHQKSKCSGKFQQNKEKIAKCINDKNKDTFLLKLMEILDNCSKVKCDESSTGFYDDV